MYKQILVATDGSAHARRAVDAACGLAKACAASISILHVRGGGEVPATLRHLVEVEHLVEPEQLRFTNVADVGSNLAMAQSVGESAAHQFRVWAAIGERVVEDASNAARCLDLEIGFARMADGDPVEQIMLALEESGADLVVLGRRGVSDIKGLLLGSVSHKICQLADSAVLTVR
jgi:nucleotide-binding universal stress UspA family protein